MTNLLAEQDEIVLRDEPRLYHYRGKTYRSLTDRMQHAGFGFDFSVVPPAILKRACDRGDAVHMACHYFDDKDLDMDSIDPAIRGYVEAYIRFTVECPGKVVAVEKKMVSETMNLACTPDLVRFIGGRRAVVERKTSQNLGMGAQLQTMGQMKVWNSLFPKTPVHDRYGLKLQANGFYKLIPHEDPDDEPAFDAMLAYSFAKERRDVWEMKYGWRKA